MHYQNCTCCMFPADGKLIVEYNRDFNKYNIKKNKPKVTSFPQFNNFEKNLLENFFFRYTSSLYKYNTIHDDKVELDKVIDKLDIEESSKETD